MTERPGDMSFEQPKDDGGKDGGERDDRAGPGKPDRRCQSCGALEGTPHHKNCPDK
jgi:hypothetical protein